MSIHRLGPRREPLEPPEAPKETTRSPYSVEVGVAGWVGGFGEGDAAICQTPAAPKRGDSGARLGKALGGARSPTVPGWASHFVVQALRGWAPPDGAWQARTSFPPSSPLPSLRSFLWFIGQGWTPRLRPGSMSGCGPGRRCLDLSPLPAASRLSSPPLTPCWSGTCKLPAVPLCSIPPRFGA